MHLAHRIDPYVFSDHCSTIRSFTALMISCAAHPSIVQLLAGSSLTSCFEYEIFPQQKFPAMGDYYIIEPE